MAAIFTGVGLRGIFTIAPTPVPPPPPPPPPTGYELLMVAGGGGGGAVAGWGAGGGGGGGGLRYLPSISIVPGTTYNITVGAGGALGQSGSDSVFSNSSMYSNSFSGNGDYLYTEQNTAFSLGTGDFTVECWIYPTDVSGITQRGFLQTSTTVGGLQPSYSNGIVIYFGARLNGGGNSPSNVVTVNGGLLAIVNDTVVGSTSTSAIASVNQWQHVALVRNNSTLTLYYNGTALGSVASTANITAQNVCIGGYYNANYLYSGNISNLRIVKGTAIYTSNFTPSTAPLTAVPNTVLLTCQSSTFVDNSGNNFTLTPVGNVSISNSNQASIIANGGGGGGNFNAWNSGTVGLSGGSGGGGAGNYYGDIPGGAEIPGQGQAGGQGKGYFNNQGSYVGGGGGGAGTAGIPGVDGGHGGNGLQYWGQYYAGGGGGGVIYEYGTVYIPLGGIGGGGNGAGSNTDGGSDGAPNTGGGGGGGRTGGSGIVILRYPSTASPAAAVTGTYTVEIQGGYRFYKFTGSGTITF